MGDPRKTRKKYSTPSHPWQKTRIEEESVLIEKYALKNKEEIWKMNSMLKVLKKQAKKLSSINNKQSEKEKEMLLNKLLRIGLLKEGDNLESVLILKLEDMLERRLETVVYRKNLARSMSQSRQFIVHRHIKLNGKVITAPSYIVLKNEEEKITFDEKSSLSNLDNPERQIAKPIENKKEEKESKKPSKKKEEKTNEIKKEDKKESKKPSKKKENKKEKTEEKS